MKLFGTTKDKNGNALPEVLIEIKDESFHTLYQTKSDARGIYSIELPVGTYAFLTAVREYGESYLEYWCQNICITREVRLDIKIDTLEVYGLQVFTVKGAYPSLMIYFRPMSLTKYQNHDADICPNLQKMRVWINEKEAPILATNHVKEHIGERTLNAFLIQAALPGNVKWERLDLEILDETNAYGAATVFAE